MPYIDSEGVTANEWVVKFYYSITPHSTLINQVKNNKVKRMQISEYSQKINAVITTSKALVHAPL